mmetsp:Transcript_12594/g.58231  ORF Transcript_12594/g.58231 Transcript_12594/m.58231 type:complete len:251 (+) Transcript_12594:719-1471(+)
MPRFSVLLVHVVRPLRVPHEVQDAHVLPLRDQRVVFGDAVQGEGSSRPRGVPRLPHRDRFPLEGIRESRRAGMNGGAGCRCNTRRARSIDAIPGRCRAAWTDPGEGDGRARERGGHPRRSRVRSNPVPTPVPVRFSVSDSVTWTTLGRASRGDRGERGPGTHPAGKDAHDRANVVVRRGHRRHPRAPSRRHSCAPTRVGTAMDSETRSSRAAVDDPRGVIGRPIRRLDARGDQQRRPTAAAVGSHPRRRL